MTLGHRSLGTRTAGAVGCLVATLAAAVAPVVASRQVAPRVEVGYCAALKDLEATKTAGFDYAELRVSEVSALSDAEFEALVTRLSQLALPTPVANNFIPGTVKVTGPQVDVAAETAYLTKAFARMSRVGVKIIVFGSSGARNYPDGFAKDAAFRQLVEFGKLAAPLARARGITLAVEPLRRQESNIINTAAEGLELVKAVDDPNFQLMVDFYHLASEREDPSILFTAKPYIRHLHMANPIGRVFPLKWDEYDYVKFFEDLKAIGYAGRISVEASTKDFAAEAPQTIALLRRAFQ
jgi:sugar phosphate isomerase/epimerase